MVLYRLWKLFKTAGSNHHFQSNLSTLLETPAVLDCQTDCTTSYLWCSVQLSFCCSLEQFQLSPYPILVQLCIIIRIYTCTYTIASSAPLRPLEENEKTIAEEYIVIFKKAASEIDGQCITYNAVYVHAWWHRYS